MFLPLQNNNLLSDFNNGNHIVIRFGPINDNIRLNTMDATVNPGYVTIKQNGFYQLNASLGTSVTTSSNLNIFQVFNVEKSSDGGGNMDNSFWHTNSFLNPTKF